MTGYWPFWLAALGAAISLQATTVAGADLKQDCGILQLEKIEFSTPQGCLKAANRARTNAEEKGTTQYVADDLDKVELLCEAGDIGQARHLLEQALREAGRCADAR